MKKKVVVSQRALVQRIGRALKERNQLLHFCRYKRWNVYCLIDLKKNVVIQWRVNINELARKLGVLKPVETVAA